MDTVENNFYSKTWIYISIQYIFTCDLDMLYKENLRWLKH